MHWPALQTNLTSITHIKCAQITLCVFTSDPTRDLRPHIHLGLSGFHSKPMYFVPFMIQSLSGNSYSRTSLPFTPGVVDTLECLPYVCFANPRLSLDDIQVSLLSLQYGRDKIPSVVILKKNNANSILHPVWLPKGLQPCRESLFLEHV